MTKARTKKEKSFLSESFIERERGGKRPKKQRTWLEFLECTLQRKEIKFLYLFCSLFIFGSSIMINFKEQTIWNQ